MYVPKIVKSLTLGTLIVISGCKSNIHKFNGESKFLSFADSMAAKTSEILKDTTFKCFFRDTVEISDKTLNDPNKFIKSIEKDLKKKIPQIETGEVNLDHTPQAVPDGSGGTTIISSFSPSSETKPKFDVNSLKVVVEEGLFADKNERRFYIPIAGYGKTNK